MPKNFVRDWTKAIHSIGKGPAPITRAKKRAASKPDVHFWGIGGRGLCGFTFTSAADATGRATYEYARVTCKGCRKALEERDRQELLMRPAYSHAQILWEKIQGLTQEDAIKAIVRALDEYKDPCDE